MTRRRAARPSPDDASARHRPPAEERRGASRSAELRPQKAVHGEAPAPAVAAPGEAAKADAAAAMKSYALLSPEVKRHYLAYFKMVFDDGRLDLRTKELIALGAALMTGAPNVLAGHLAKLRRLGVTEEEIAEAVAVALGVAGASVVDRGDVAEALLKGKAAPGGKP